MPLLTSCGVSEPGSNRPAERHVTPPPRTPIPEGTVPCQDDPTQLCLSDEQMAQLLRAFNAGEAERDRIICYLRAWFAYEPCPVD